MNTRTELLTLAEEQRTLPERRGALVERARAEGMTWREIADLLGMTEHGLIKAAKLRASHNDERARPGRQVQDGP
ncbi:hypothetical protein [Rathayibacter sp. AY1E6]|uniref:hypothetical protein n=1 Tax=Rathayibacter sp. AY1E6 TaxID=2080554 RepID=UPI0011B05508|nr:hypothetical protein [Rathayibacter sp. AY1E6]